MLDNEILKTNYGVSYGSVTLKSLQNDNIPELDLLVREAIQNSADAALTEPGPSYVVNFKSGHFIPSQFNSFLTNIEERLNTLFPESTSEYLEIRDTKTSGLTGSIRKSEIKKDDHGNFFKLIFDTGKRQTITTAGGNWGFGKSVYYRVGIGIVIFYSRIKIEAGFEDRLIITLVEDESKKDREGHDLTILNSLEPQSAGKAWWGIRDGEDLLPLTDMRFIKPILDVFDISPFKENETGTSIIIPYINTQELLNGIIPVEAEIRDDVRDHLTSIWASSITDYLRLSIQKWYAPKIHNRELPNFCNNKWLLVSVDNVPIRKQDMLPFFRLTQELYTAALAKVHNHEYTSPAFSQIKLLPIKITRYFEGGITAGYVAMIKVSSSEMNGTQSVLSPYDYIGRYEADGGFNEPIVMYARDPGMVIDYAITGAWVKNLTPPDNPEEFLFAFFVPISEKLIKPDFPVPEYAGMSLGEYLRNCEASDHMGWNDPVKMQIVQKIQRNTINAINNQIRASAIVNVDATASKLSNRLGKNLLPKVGYGKKPGTGGGGSGGTTGTKLTNIAFSITAQTIRANEVEMEYQLRLSHGKRDAKISLMIASEAGWIDAESWENDIGIDFPVQIVSWSIETVKIPVIDIPYAIMKNCSQNNNTIETDEVSLSIVSETVRHTFTQVQYSSHVLNPEIKGRIVLRTYSKKYQFTFRVE